MSLERRVFAFFLLITLLVMTGCGPILSTKGTSDAKDALAKAEAANAAELAPYEYTLAQEYLRKADELWGHSKFGDSHTYAQKALEMANAAEEKAKTNPYKNPLTSN